MSGFVSGPPRIILRLGGLAVLALSAFAYARYGVEWTVFAQGFGLTHLGLTSKAAKEGQYA